MSGYDMAVTVADVVGMPVLRRSGARVVAGHAGLGRDVRWAHAAELVDIASLLREGDLLLSTGIAMPDTADELRAFATSLQDIRAAGVVVELGRRWQELPPALVAGCDELGLPLVAVSREVGFAAVTQAIGERILAEQLAELRRAQRVHETFTSLSIAEAGPEAILEAVQRLSGAAVVIEGEQHQVLDYRSGPDDIGGVLADWSTRSAAVRLEGRTTWDEDNGWLVTRVGRRERGWGRLVVHLATPPSEGMIAMAERAAAALALHRLHDRQRDSAVRRTHHELIVGLLADPNDPDLLRRSELAGMPSAGRTLVGLSLRPLVERPTGSTGRTGRVDEVIAATVHAAQEARVPALVCDVEGDVRALLSLPPTADVNRVVDDLAVHVCRRHRAVVGAGRPALRAADIDRTLREAQHVVESVRTADARPVHRLEDVHLRGLLALLASDDRVRLFSERELEPLRRHDTEHDAQLLEAVRALLLHPTSKSAAAGSIHLSRPVFYDRLARAEHVLGRDLDDPDVRSSLHVALLVDEITTGD